MYLEDTTQSMPWQLVTLLDLLDIDSLNMRITEQLSEFNINVEPNPTNYLELLMSNLEECKTEDYYDAWKEDIEERVINLYNFVESKLQKKFGVELGLDFDSLGYEEYTKRIEALYEFFFIRKYENIGKFFTLEVMKRKKELAAAFKKELDTKDILVTVSKKRWNDPEYVIILNFLDDIIKSIKNTEFDLSDLIHTVVDNDLEEVTNYTINEMIEDQGRGLVVAEEIRSYSRYLSCLSKGTLYYRIKNDVKENIMKQIEPKQ